MYKKNNFCLNYLSNYFNIMIPMKTFIDNCFFGFSFLFVPMALYSARQRVEEIFLKLDHSSVEEFSCSISIRNFLLTHIQWDMNFKLCFSGRGYELNHILLWFPFVPWYVLIRCWLRIKLPPKAVAAAFFLLWK